MQSFSDLFANNKLLALAAIFIVLVAVVVIGLLLSRLMFGRRLSTGASNRARQPRLGVVDAFDLDRQRQLVIVRRDNVEHLVMIGGPNDLVIETAIVRAPGATLQPPPRDKDQIASPSIAAVIAPVQSPTNASPTPAPSVTVAPAPAPSIAPPPPVVPLVSVEAPATVPSAPPPVTRDMPPSPPAPRAAQTPLPPRPAPPPPARPSAPPPPVPAAPRSVAPAPPRPPVRPFTTPTRTAPLPSLPPRPAPIPPREAADQAGGADPVAKAEPATNRPSEEPASMRPASAPAPAPEKRSEATSIGSEKPKFESTSGERLAAPPDPQPRPAAAPARSAPVRSIEGLESLEEEMAKLLGRPSVPPEKS